MKTATAKLKSTSPYSQSKYLDQEENPKLEKENSADYEKRVWRYRVHQNEKGYVIIPQMAFKNCLSEAAKYLKIRIPGQGKATYTKNFEAGVMVMDPMVLPVKWVDVQCQKLLLPSDGVRGSGKRVVKFMPFIKAWAGTVVFHVLDETITEELFRVVLDQAGKFIGIGSFRPRNNGYFGRFSIESIAWQ